MKLIPTFAVPILLLFSLVGVSAAQTRAPRHINEGAALYLEDMHGFENYLLDAIQKKQVPVVIVDDREKADFFVRGGASTYSGKTQAGIKAVNKDGDVVFAYYYGDTYAMHGKQSAAESCAKHLKKEILGQE